MEGREKCWIRESVSFGSGMSWTFRISNKKWINTYVIVGNCVFEW